jgi:hypothetical protein
MVNEIILAITNISNTYFSMIANKDWSINTETKDGQTCVHAHISDSLDISGLEFSLLDEERKLIVRMKVNSHEIYFCTAIGEPMFAQLGDSVKYVDGSGADFYKEKIQTEKIP